ncbi:hypothetical protein CDD83_6300 [Cordyceps sp. RAO-2017]|nr:hypothetical protein CDD83_6300 [Cordyceps sp. RAO-2017]
MRALHPHLVGRPRRFLDRWYSHAYGAPVAAVLPVAEVDGLDISFARASRPNGADEPSWDAGPEKDYRLPAEA